MNIVVSLSRAASQFVKRPWPNNTDVYLAGFAALYTIVMAWDSLATGIGHDDLMNLTHAWRPGIIDLLSDNIEFYQVGSAHRPLGEVFYWIFFRLFAFDPFPYRVACLSLLAINTALLFWVCRLLGAPRTATVLACLFHGYHYGFWALYYNTGTCYDLLAFVFYFLTVGTYIRTRRTGPPGALDILGVCALCILGLNSKEIAVTLPGVLLGYEILWRRTLPSGALHLWIPPAALVAVYAAGHFGGEGSLANLSSYSPHLSLAQYWHFLERTFPEVFYAYGWPRAAVAGAAVVMLISIAALTRGRAAAFGVWLFAAGVIPIAFIDPRSLYAAYIPLAGVAIAYAIGVDSAARALGRVTHPAVRVAVCAAVVAGVVSTHLWVRRHGIADQMMASQAEEISAIRRRLRELVPSPPPGSRILLLEDPFQQVEDAWFKGWASVFLVELMYDEVHVDQRFRMDPPPDAEAIAGYDYVLTSRDARLELVRVQ